MVTTGVLFNTFLKASFSNKDVVGMLGDKNQGWYPNTIKSYEVSLRVNGCNSVGLLKTLSGMASKKLSLLQGKVNFVTGFTITFSIAKPGSSKGNKKLCTISPSCPVCV